MRRYVIFGILFTAIISLISCTPGTQQNPGETAVPVVSNEDDNIVISEAVLQAAEKECSVFKVLALSRKSW